jgi:hypothetical protein
LTHPYRRHPTLRPGDVAVALQLALTPGVQYELLSLKVRMCVSQTHNALKRLEIAGLADAEPRAVDGTRLLDFIYYGVPHAFPPVLGGHVAGVAVALPPGKGQQPLRSIDSIVWPWKGGSAQGTALMPLYRGAPRVARTNRRLHVLLVAVDIVRLGPASHRDPDVSLVLSEVLRRH